MQGKRVGRGTSGTEIPGKETLFENWLIAIVAPSLGQAIIRVANSRDAHVLFQALAWSLGQQRKPVVNSYECNFGFVMNMGLVRADGSSKCMHLFISQGHHWVDPRSPAGWKIPCHRRNGQHDERGPRNCQRISRRQAKWGQFDVEAALCRHLAR